MKYMLLIYGNQELWESFPPEELAKVVQETDALHRELRGSGEFIGAWGVADQVNAKTVTLDNGVPVVSDGPYLEAKEWVAGFDILECRDLDEAIEVAAKHPMARRGTLELRPFWTLYDESGRLIDESDEDDG